MLTTDRLELFLRSFPGLTIALLGDLFLDRYLEIDASVEEMSIETGLEAYQVTHVRNAPGALGTVLNNLAALGVGRLVPVTVVGDDGHAFDLLRELEKLPVDGQHVLRDSDRLTPTYTKPLRRDAQGHWLELNRLDVRTREPLSDTITQRLRQRLQAAFAAADGLIVLDQVVESNWGVVNAAVRDELARLAASYPDKLIYIDSRAHLGHFAVGTLKGNRHEVSAAAGVPAEDDPGVQAAAGRLAQRTGRTAFCTWGDQGILVASPDGTSQLVPGYRVTGPVDIVGAGDAATSGIVTSLLSGATADEAALVGNLVASITVQQLGTTGTATPDQVRQRWAAYQASVT